MTRWVRRAAASLPLLLVLSAAPAPALVMPVVQTPLASVNGDGGPEDVITTVLFHGRPVPVVGHIDVLPAQPPPPDPGPGGGAVPDAPAEPQQTPGAGQHWCGAARSTDAAPAPDRASVQLVYAFPTDRPDRFAAFRDGLQGDASVIRSFLATESGGRKTLRFAGEGHCAAGVDIGVLPLSGPRSAYLDRDGAPSVEALSGEVKAAFPPPRSVAVNYLVFADNLASPSDCCITGTGSHYEDSAKNSPSIHDAGGLTAAVWGVDGWSPEPGSTAYFPDLFLHEITHTLGGVANDAPHSTGAGHCTDQADIMCYADGGPRNTMSTLCPALSGAINAAFDCGQDDYFSPTPTPGSYLATHWNVYDSAFLEPALPVAVGGDPPAPQPAAPPARTARQLRAVLRTPGGKRVGSAVLDVTRNSATRIDLVQQARGLRLRAAPRHAALRVVLCAWPTTAGGRALGARRCTAHAVRSHDGHAALLPLPRLRFAAPRGHMRASLSVLARPGRGRWHRYASTAPRALSVAL